MSFVKIRVSNRQLLTPGMVRVTFAGPEIDHFEDSGVPDEFVRVFFPDAQTGILPVPATDDAGRALFPQGVTPPYAEYYTIRRIDKASRKLDIDFVVHEGGIASEWAQAAQPGDEIVISKAFFSYEPPAGMEWQVLLADATSLPALGRILEQTPPDIPTTAIIEVAHSSHRQDLVVRDNVDIRWIYGSGNGASPSQLPQNLRAMTLPPGEGYIWMAGEMQPTRAIRRYLRKDLCMPGKNLTIMRYWLDNKEAWRARWEGLAPSVRQEIEDLWASDRDPEDKTDTWHNILEKHGL